MQAAVHGRAEDQAAGWGQGLGYQVEEVSLSGKSLSRCTCLNENRVSGIGFTATRFLHLATVSPARGSADGSPGRWLSTSWPRSITSIRNRGRMQAATREGNQRRRNESDARSLTKKIVDVFDVNMARRHLHRVQCNQDSKIQL